MRSTRAPPKDKVHGWLVVSREPANEGSRRYTYTRDTQGDPGRRGVRVRKTNGTQRTHTQHARIHRRERETEDTTETHTNADG